MARRPNEKIYAYWLQDVGGDWLLRANSSRRGLEVRRRTEGKRYRVTEIGVFHLADVGQRDRSSVSRPRQRVQLPASPRAARRS